MPYFWVPYFYFCPPQGRANNGAGNEPDAASLLETCPNTSQQHGNAARLLHTSCLEYILVWRGTSASYLVSALKSCLQLADTSRNPWEDGKGAATPTPSTWD